MGKKKHKIDKGYGIRVSGTVSRYNNEVSLIASDFYEICEQVEMPSDKKQRTITISSVTHENCKITSSFDIEEELSFCLDSSEDES